MMSDAVINCMKGAKKPLRNRRAWKALESHYERTKELHLRKLFAGKCRTRDTTIDGP
jgi:hypothetical protein